MKPTSKMLRRPDLASRFKRSSGASAPRQPGRSADDPVAERLRALVRALEETIIEQRDRTIACKVEERIGENFRALTDKPKARPRTIQCRVVGYDQGEDCEPVSRLPLGGLPVRLVMGKEKIGPIATGAAGLVLFELPEAVGGAYCLEVCAPDGGIIARVRGKYRPERGVARLVELGRDRQLEPAFARGRNLVLAADRARSQAVRIGPKIERALAQQEKSLREEIAALDATLASPEHQGKGETDGTDAQDQERQR